MEWFQAALDRYKQQQHHHQSPPRSGPGRTQPIRAIPATIVYTRTRSVQIPEPVLREQRILSGFEGGRSSIRSKSFARRCCIGSEKRDGTSSV